MSAEHTQQQPYDDQLRAKQLSLKRTSAPAEIPGYETQRLLGTGAYGEVWVGVDRTTGRHVAIKFFRHRTGVDWQLLSREVEKLVFLSADRYVVQLLDVGWSHEPPYYVMEYVEGGSLQEYLALHGALPVNEAVRMFHDITVGLMHAHGKGVLHCDLKPANILLDEDHKPRLADFGQSRLSHEQQPALGTLFYMAPEQADLEAVPDARWDVYALGALLYCLVTGSPPHRNDETLKEIDTAVDLPDRLAKYRTLIRNAPPITQHRRVRGMDRALAEIIDRCLAIDPESRYPNVQSVLDALEHRDEARARVPLMVMGIVAPMLLLLIMTLFGWRGYNRALVDSDTAIVGRAQESNRFAAEYVATNVSSEIERYYRTVERVAQDEAFQTTVIDTIRDEDLQPLLERLSDPAAMEAMADDRERFRMHPDREELQRRVEKLMEDEYIPRAASWFVTGDDGLQIASVFEGDASSSLGKNFAWRTYFHGGPSDLPRDARRPQVSHITRTTFSAPYRSTSTNAWKVAISTPIIKNGDFLGVVGMSIELGNIINFQGNPQHAQFAVLVDNRPGDQQGTIIQHPLLERLRKEQGIPPGRLNDYRVNIEQSELDNPAYRYRDPFGEDVEGGEYQRDWIVAASPVKLPQPRGAADRAAGDSGLMVLVQEDRAAATAPTRQLGKRLAAEAIWALGIVLIVIFALWFFVIRNANEWRDTRRAKVLPKKTKSAIAGQPTLALRTETKK